MRAFQSKTWSDFLSSISYSACVPCRMTTVVQAKLQLFAVAVTGFSCGLSQTGESQVLTNWKLSLVCVASAFVAACGGGASDPTPRGAIAYNASTGHASIAVNHTSQVDADTEAVRQCPYGGCSIVLQFSGNGACGSLVTSSNGAWGAASGGSKELADTRAQEDCVRRGGVDCSKHPLQYVIGYTNAGDPIRIGLSENQCNS